MLSLCFLSVLQLLIVPVFMKKTRMYFYEKKVGKNCLLIFLAKMIFESKNFFCEKIFSIQRDK